MKKALSVGVLFFVIGGLIGLGIGKMWWRNAPASDTAKVSDAAELNTATAAFPQGVGDQPTDQAGAKQDNAETMKKDEVMKASDADTSKKAEPAAVPAASEHMDEKMAATGGSSAVSAGDQAPGMQVTLTAVSLEHAGWAVIHEDKSGKPGSILGAQRLDGGSHSNVVVDLLRATTAGGTYYAMLHSDNGDRTFDYKIDVPLVDGSGNPVMTRFTAVAQ